MIEIGMGQKSLNDPIVTSTSQGRMIFNIFASLAEFERDVIRERTMAGLKSARHEVEWGVGHQGYQQKAKGMQLQQRPCIKMDLYQ